MAAANKERFGRHEVKKSYQCERRVKPDTPQRTSKDINTLVKSISPGLDLVERSFLSVLSVS